MIEFTEKNLHYHFLSKNQLGISLFLFKVVIINKLQPIGSSIKTEFLDISCRLMKQSLQSNFEQGSSYIPRALNVGHYSFYYASMSYFLYRNQEDLAHTIMIRCFQDNDYYGHSKLCTMQGGVLRLWFYHLRDKQLYEQAQLFLVFARDKGVSIPDKMWEECLPPNVEAAQLTGANCAGEVVAVVADSAETLHDVDDASNEYSLFSKHIDVAFKLTSAEDVVTAGTGRDETFKEYRLFAPSFDEVLLQ